jgi:hypothetical protein
MRRLQHHGHFDRKDWVIYAAVVAVVIVAMATYLVVLRAAIVIRTFSRVFGRRRNWCDA